MAGKPGCLLPDRLEIIAAERAMGASARVVDNDVDAAEMGRYRLRHFDDFGLIGHIHLPGARYAPVAYDVASNDLAAIERPVGDGDLRPFGGQKFGRRAPDTA